MAQEQSEYSVVQLSIASKLDRNSKQCIHLAPFYENYCSSSEANETLIQKGTNPEGFNNEATKDAKSIEMSEFSLIIQEGLQNARRQSQHETVIKEIYSQIIDNQRLLIQQNSEMQGLVNAHLLQLQEQQLHERALNLITDFKKIQEKFNYQLRLSNKSKKGRILSPNYFSKKNSFKLQEKGFKSKKTNIIKHNIKGKNHDLPDSNITKRHCSNHKGSISFDYFQTVRNKETITKQKQLLINRINVIKESIEMAMMTSKNKIEKLKYQNMLLKSEIKVTENEIYDQERKRTFIKDKTVKYGSKNLNTLIQARKTSLKARKSSLLKKQGSKNLILSVHSLSKKSLRILSAHHKKQVACKKQPTRYLAVRDQYFDRAKMMKRIVTQEEIPFRKTEYY